MARAAIVRPNEALWKDDTATKYATDGQRSMTGREQVLMQVLHAFIAAEARFFEVPFIQIQRQREMIQTLAALCCFIGSIDHEHAGALHGGTVHIWDAVEHQLPFAPLTGTASCSAPNKPTSWAASSCGPASHLRESSTFTDNAPCKLRPAS